MFDLLPVIPRLGFTLKTQVLLPRLVATHVVTCKKLCRIERLPRGLPCTGHLGQQAMGSLAEAQRVGRGEAPCTEDFRTARQCPPQPVTATPPRPSEGQRARRLPQEAAAAASQRNSWPDTAGLCQTFACIKLLTPSLSFSFLMHLHENSGVLRACG